MLSPSDKRNGITYTHNTYLCLIQVHRKKSKHQLTNKIKMLKSILKPDSQTIIFSRFSDVLERCYKTKVISELEHIKRANGKLVCYSTICHDFSLKNYLGFDIPKRIRCLLTRLRISAHSLAIETGRYSKPKAPLEERVCRFCTNNVESEKHFMSECSR